MTPDGAHSAGGVDDVTPPAQAITTATDGAVFLVFTVQGYARLVTQVPPAGYTMIQSDIETGVATGLGMKVIPTAGLETPGSWQSTPVGAQPEFVTMSVVLKPVG